MTFDQWIGTVCEIISNRTKKEITEVYSSINLTDAKLSFIDGVSPEDYKPFNPN